MPTIDPTPEQLHAHIAGQPLERKPGFYECTFSNEARIDAAELAALRKDAERYRWLRERHEVLCRMHTAKGLGLDLSAVYVRSAEQFDGVIDAAMAAGGAAVGAA